MSSSIHKLQSIHIWIGKARGGNICLLIDPSCQMFYMASTMALHRTAHGENIVVKSSHSGRIHPSDWMDTPAIFQAQLKLNFPPYPYIFTPLETH